MNLALLQALAIATGGLSSLGAVLIVLLLLDGKRGAAPGYAFGLAYAGSYLVIGLGSLWLGRSMVAVEADAGPSPLRSVAFSLLGLVMLVAALRQRRTKAGEESGDEGEGQPAGISTLLAKIDGQGPMRALAFGALVPWLNVKNLAIYLPAIAVLAAASLPPVEGALAVGLTTLVFCGGPLGVLLVYGIFRRRAADWLGRLRLWIENNGQRIVRVVLPLIGSLLLIQGCRGLWSWYFG
ncbi:MAG: GAP family protein [Myxococcales bacterium]|nr:GAP family protein [Myxococcales bacterium]MCA9696147.1 GAP family protein [Myxococcales bacterium]